MKTSHRQKVWLDFQTIYEIVGEFLLYLLNRLLLFSGHRLVETSYISLSLRDPLVDVALDAIEVLGEWNSLLELRQSVLALLADVVVAILDRVEFLLDIDDLFTWENWRQMMLGL